MRLVRVGDSVHRVIARRDGGRGRYTLWVDGWSYEVEALDANPTGTASAGTGEELPSSTATVGVTGNVVPVPVREAGEELPANLTKAEASEHIDRLQKGRDAGK